METTKTNSEALNEGAKVIEKLFNDNASSMMDVYKKQMDLSVGFRAEWRYSQYVFEY